MTASTCEVGRRAARRRSPRCRRSPTRAPTRARAATSRSASTTPSWFVPPSLTNRDLAADVADGRVGERRDAARAARPGSQRALASENASSSPRGRGDRGVLRAHLAAARQLEHEVGAGRARARGGRVGARLRAAVDGDDDLEAVARPVERERVRDLARRSPPPRRRRRRSATRTACRRRPPAPRGGLPRARRSAARNSAVADLRPGELAAAAQKTRRASGRCIGAGMVAGSRARLCAMPPHPEPAAHRRRDHACAAPRGARRRRRSWPPARTRRSRAGRACRRRTRARTPRRFIALAATEAAAGEAIALAIADAEDDRLIGTIGLMEVDRRARPRRDRLLDRGRRRAAAARRRARSCSCATGRSPSSA